MMLFFCITGSILLALLPHILWRIGWTGCKIAGCRLPYKYFGISALVIAIVFILTMAYGYYIGRWKIKSTEIEYSHNDIPQVFDGFKIVHISDLHLSTFDDSRERFRGFIAKINKHNPDLVCFTEDLVTLGKEEAEDGSRITFLGVDNANFSNQGFHTIHKGDQNKTMDGTQGFRILLSHDPSHWSAEVIPNTDIPLTLSGHTHSAQIRIFGWTPAKWSFKETAGRYDRDGQTLYINIGLGCTAPIRLGVNQEVTVITLKN